MRFGKVASIGMIISAVALLSGCGVQQTDLTSRFMTVDQQNQTVKINLEAGYNEHNNQQNFNGYSDGGMTITVPVGYTVELNYVNGSGIPTDVGVYTANKQLAFSGAGDSIHDIYFNAVAGVYPGQSETVKFTANQVGTYVIANYLDRFMGLGNTDYQDNIRNNDYQNAYQNSGMWDYFKVVNGGTPSITAK